MKFDWQIFKWQAWIFLCKSFGSSEYRYKWYESAIRLRREDLLGIRTIYLYAKYFKDSDGAFYQNQTCPLAKAIKEQTLSKMVEEVINYSLIDGVRYFHSPYGYFDFLKDKEKADPINSPNKIMRTFKLTKQST